MPPGLTRPALLFVVICSLLCASAQAQPGPRPSTIEHPYRKAGGRYWSLPAGTGAVPGVVPPGWDYIMGKVSQNSADGIYVRRYQNDKTVFVRRYPYVVADGTFVTFLAFQDGLKQFETVQHALATIPQYDYGEPYDPFALPKKTNITVKILPANTNQILATNPTAAATSSTVTKTNLTRTISK
jgi:hypothetical protein